jgi:putative aldouronate transport system permease protein
MALARSIKNRSRFSHYIKNYWILHVFLIPGMLLILIFNYIPMGGIIIAFKNYSIFKGVLASPWIGFANFRYLFNSRDFWRVLNNSVSISLLKLVWGFPVPIILALMMNEMRSVRYKRLTQTLLYLPHFLSWVIVMGIIFNMLSYTTGLFNYALVALGQDRIAFLNEKSMIRTIVVTSEIWKNAGWGTIIYMAAMSNIDPTYYEAAIIDGATRLQRIRYITIPGIMNTIIVLLILNMGSIMRNGFEQIYLMQNGMNKAVIEVFELYTYQVGLLEGRYNFATAVGIFQSVIGCIFLFTTNSLSHKVRGSGLW